MGRICHENGRKSFGSTTINGYKSIEIARSKYFIHRLVVIAFIRELIGNEEVNHKNANKKDNRLENLEIVTHQTNMMLTIYTGSKDCKPVEQIDMEGNLVADLRVSIILQ